MSTTAQIEANRANAQHSTGPVTADGKAASSKNATTHGLNSPTIFVQPGEEAEFLAFQAELQSAYMAAGDLEEKLVDSIVHAAWNVRRCRKLEALLQNEANVAGLIDPMLDDALARKFDRIERYRKAAERRERLAINDLRKLQTESVYRCENNLDTADKIPPLADTMKTSTQLNREKAFRARFARKQEENYFANFDAHLNAEIAAAMRSSRNTASDSSQPQTFRT